MSAGLSEIDSRKAFEAWISAPPFEKDTLRYPDNVEKFSFPGQYQSALVQVAWEAWKQGTEWGWQ